MRTSLRLLCCGMKANMLLSSNILYSFDLLRGE
jgi:hypothetical protein